ncbi:MAG: ABC transporter permease subunit, partial [Bdellovibrionota bacterium]
PFLSSTVVPAMQKVVGFLPIFSGPFYGVSLFSASLVLVIMVVPFIVSISREVLLAVPVEQREASFALGSTHWETVWKVVLPNARRGIYASVFLALARALGETMAVTMVIGNTPQIAKSLLAPGYTIAAVVANEFTEATGDLYLSALIELGLVLFGIPDWIIYGRPWESLWMYLQYNLFTGLAVKTFGAQPLREYWEFLGSRWMGTLAPWGIPLAGFAFLGILPAIGAGEPWAYAAVLYLVPHLMVTHKEGRFLAPLEPFLIWAAVSGLRAWLPKIPLRRARVPALRLVAGAFLAVNAVLVVRILWGELYRTAWIYTEVTSKLQNSPDTCAVITVDRRLPSSYYPRVANLAIFVAERDPSSLAQAKTNPLVWSEHLPSCTPDQKILLQVGRVDDAWNAKGCELLPSGILKILPRERWEWAVQNHVSGSVWYRCPSSVTALFARQSVEHPFVTSLTRLAALPPIGTTSDQILKEFPVKQRYYSCLTLCD